MTNHDTQHILTQLETIQDDAMTLRLAVAGQASPLDIESALARIWAVSVALQRRLCTSRTVAGYREDALAQVARVWELAGECGLAPDDRQLAGLGYACDLAAAKVKKYQRIANHSARLEVLTGVATIMEEA